MPRSLSLLVLVAVVGCAPAPELLSPRVKPPPMPKPWPAAVYRVDGPAKVVAAMPSADSLQRSAP